MMPAAAPGDNAKSGKKKLWTIIFLISLAAVLVIIGVRLFGNDGEMLQIDQAPEEFVLETYSGERIDTANLQGKVVLINFWASWCDPCEEEALFLEEAWQQIGQGSSKAVFLGVAYNDTESASMAFLEEFGITYPNGPDLRGEISGIYQVQGVPETYILDQSGRLRYVKFGPFITTDEILRALDQVFANMEGE